MSSPAARVPVEVTMRVASYLDFRDVWVSRRVCQKWKQIFMACKEL